MHRVKSWPGFEHSREIVMLPLGSTVSVNLGVDTITMCRWDVSYLLSFQLLVAVDQLLMLSLRVWHHALPPARESPIVTYFAGFGVT